MPHEQSDRTPPRRWLLNAQADLALARVSLPEGGMYEHLCFHAQQAAEKALKAVLLHHGIHFPYTHNIQSLVSLLPDDLASDPRVRRAVSLTPYAVSARHPVETEPVLAEEYEVAITIAADTLEWAEAAVAYAR